jgi:hypothetical protein
VGQRRLPDRQIGLREPRQDARTPSRSDRGRFLKTIFTFSCFYEMCQQRCGSTQIWPPNRQSRRQHISQTCTPLTHNSMHRILMIIGFRGLESEENHRFIKV